MPRIDPLQPEDLSCHLSGLYFDWHYDGLQRFLELANANPSASTPPVPHWATETLGRLTVDAFIRDAMVFLSEVVDEVSGWTLIVTSPDQVSRLSARMGHLEMEPFTQVCIDSLGDSKGLVTVRRIMGVGETLAQP